MAQNYPPPINYPPQNYPSTAQRQSAVGGISVEHPLQATVYAYRRGKMKLLVPFEITVVPMGGQQSDPERPPAPNGYPFSGPIQSQPPYQPPGSRFQPPYNNANSYGQPSGSYQGSQPQYNYPISTNQYPQQPPYNQYNSYNPPNTGYYNQQPPQNPYYQPPRGGAYQPPQYRPTYQQVGKCI